MRLAALATLVPGDHLESRLEWLRAHGLAGLEIDGADTPPVADEWHEPLRRHGIRMSALHVPAQLARQPSALAPWLEVAAQLGARGVVVPVALSRPAELEAELDALRTALTPAVAVADQANTLILLAPATAPLGPGTLGRVAAWCRRLRTPALRLAAHVADLHEAGENVAAALDGAQDMVEHVLVADAGWRPLGEGGLNLVPVIKVLHRISYDRFVTLAYRSPLADSQALATSARALREAVRLAWEER